MIAENQLKIARQCYHSGKISESEEILKKVLKTNPKNAEAWYYLGLIAYSVKKYELSVSLINKALEIKPEERFYLNMGFSLYALKDYETLKVCYINLIKLNPNSAEGYNNLGVAYFKNGETEQSVICHKKALELNPQLESAYSNLALAVKQQNNHEEAIKYNLKAIELNPKFAVAYYNLAIAYKDSYKIDLAIQNYKKALKIDPNYTDCYLNLAIAYLLNKNFKDGWKYYERRFEGLESPKPQLKNPKPLWNGKNLKGKTIYVIKEQGIGDTIQFVRFLPMLKQFEPDKIIFKTQKGLENILKFSNTQPEIEIISESFPDEYIDFDVYIPLLSLPYHLKINEQNIPLKNGYLITDFEKVLLYKHQYFNNDKLKVGICWQGSASHKSDFQRSLPLEYFYRLFNLPNIQIYSLQKDFGTEQLKNMPKEFNIIDLGRTFNDFTDTAAAIENLDVVITIDTAIAHLSGGLGKKVWIILPKQPEWRWFMDEHTTVWYESATLFRPELNQDRRKLFDRVFKKLEKLSSIH